MDDNSISQFFENSQMELITQSSDLSLATLSSMIESGGIDLNPDFQRRERWDIDDKSKLIESFILNVPIPAIYLSEDKFWKYTAIDGKQRLNAINWFMEWRFRLKGLKKAYFLNDCLFEDLIDDIKNVLTIRPLVRVITVLKQSDPSLKYEVFLRLNQQWERLNAQEIRNVAWKWPLNDLLLDLSVNPILRAALKIPANNKSSAFQKMEDVEFILRFLTLHNLGDNYSKDLSWSMDKFMEENQYANWDNLDIYVHDFNRAINGCDAIWGSNSFQRYDWMYRQQMVAGMYDAQMLAMAKFSDSEVESLTNNKDRIIAEFENISIQDTIFEQSVRVSTNDKAKLHYRVWIIKKILTQNL